MTVSAAELAPACEKYFADYETFLKNVPAEQATMIKQQYDNAKQQFLALPKDMQEQT
ncbi:TonB-dependent receptor, partial [Pasteurella multocida]